MKKKIEVEVQTPFVVYLIMQYTCRSHFICLLVLIGFACNVLHAQYIRPDTLTIHFSFDSYAVNKKEAGELQFFLHRHTVTNSSLSSIKILGYTDTTGTETYNMALSVKRCQSVNNGVHRFLQVFKNMKVLKQPMGEQGSGHQTDSVDRRVLLIWYYADNHLVQAAEQNEKLTLKEKEKNAGTTIGSINKIIDTVIVLDYIYFEPDRPILTAGSMNALPGYISMLKRYKKNDMEVGGHVNHEYPELKHSDPLFKLSEQRAQLVYQYLVDSGFASARLTYKGYGNTHMLFPLPNSLEEKMKNMRVEITVFRSF